MPSIKFYALGPDFDVLRDALNADEELAFVVATADCEWKAVRSVDVLAHGNHWLWHVPSGALSLPPQKGGAVIASPWDGWRAGFDLPCAQDPQTFQLNIPRAADAGLPIRAAHIGWIGGTYGRAVPATARAWWARLKRWFSNVGQPLPQTRPAQIALPAAAAEIARGRRYDPNSLPG